MAPPDPVTQMNTYKSYVTMLADPVSKDELKLKAAQELSENFEVLFRLDDFKIYILFKWWSIVSHVILIVYSWSF